MRRLVITVGIAIFIVSQPSAAEDPAASFLIRLFTNVCTTNVGQPEKVRAWAQDKHLQDVTSPAATEVFVGPGDKGSAWAVPSSVGSFALSIRGTTQACAVFARTADPDDVETYFKKLMEGVERPGIDVKVTDDTTVPSPTGARRLLAYSVSPANNPKRGFLYTLQTAEKPGGAFQASLQVAQYGSP